MKKCYYAINEHFSKNFEILLHRSPQKSLFIAFLLTNFPKISEKVLKNFSRRLLRRKRVEISQFFRPLSVEKKPLRGVTRNRPIAFSTKRYNTETIMSTFLDFFPEIHNRPKYENGRKQRTTDDENTKFLNLAQHLKMCTAQQRLIFSPPF